MILDRIRERLSNVDAVALLALFGVIVGLCSGAVILLFRLTIELSIAFFLPGSSESFEALPTYMHGALPLTGAILLGAAFHSIHKNRRRTGVAYVIERFHLHQGTISLFSLILQFWAAAVTLTCGMTMGREGPAVHLGAASGSLLGQWARLPNNSLRVLTSCGCAAAISASFNTPIAGVIFAMEVIMMEYHVGTIIPIILASVMGAVLTRAVYGHEPAFSIPDVALNSLAELPIIVLSGLFIGILASILIFLSKTFFIKTKSMGVGWRFMIAGIITSLSGMAAPEILGIGYDTVNLAMIGGLSLSSLLLITVLKIIASSACFGCGLPAGIIGPALVIGATADALFGSIWSIVSGHEANLTLYALLGMVGMMAATLEAPLAALMALLELTSATSILFPGMLVVVIASLVTNQFLKQRGAFNMLLDAQDINLRITPLASHLNRAGVASVMNRNIQRTEPAISIVAAEKMMKTKPNWILIEQTGLPHHLMPAAELALHLTSLTAEKETEKKTDKIIKKNTDDFHIDLMSIPARRENLTPILLSATLKEAMDAMQEHDVNAVYVHRMSAPNIYRVFGIITKQDIENHYHI